MVSLRWGAVLSLSVELGWRSACLQWDNRLQRAKVGERWGMWHLAWSPAPIPTIHSLNQANSPPTSSDSMYCAASHALVIKSSWDVW